MPTSIKQIEDTERGKTILRVNGSLNKSDALLLEKIALNLREETGKNMTLDLADIDFLDSESAPIISRLETEHGFEIEGIEFFLQTVVTEAEKRHS